jgi:transposase
VTGPIKEIVAGYLDEDRQHNLSKQRHTAKRINDRLCKEHGFTGGHSTIRQLVRQMKPQAKAYMPLEFDPGEAAQVDWGTAVAYIQGQRTVVQLFCMRLGHSVAIFVGAFPTQRYESFLMGHRLAEFFGGVPRRLIYNNLKTAVKEGWGKHVVQEQLPFQYLKAHYPFASTFCNPYPYILLAKKSQLKHEVSFQAMVGSESIHMRYLLACRSADVSQSLWISARSPR